MLVSLERENFDAQNLCKDSFFRFIKFIRFTKSIRAVRIRISNRVHSKMNCIKKNPNFTNMTTRWLKSIVVSIRSYAPVANRGDLSKSSWFWTFFFWIELYPYRSTWQFNFDHFWRYLPEVMLSNVFRSCQRFWIGTCRECLGTVSCVLFQGRSSDY